MNRTQKKKCKWCCSLCGCYKKCCRKNFHRLHRCKEHLPVGYTWEADAA